MIRKIKEPVWGSILHLFVNEHPDAVKKHCLRTYGIECDSGADGWVGECHGLESRPIVYMGFPDLPTNGLRVKDIGLVVHECVHAATHILESCGALYSEDGHLCYETHAYLVEFYVRSVLDRLIR